MKYFATLKRENEHYKCKVKRSLLYLSNYTNLFQSIKTLEGSSVFLSAELVDTVWQAELAFYCDSHLVHWNYRILLFVKSRLCKDRASLIKMSDFCIPKPKIFTQWWQRPMELFAVLAAVLPHYSVESILAWTLCRSVTQKVHPISLHFVLTLPWNYFTYFK